jgi:hypothetical protein
VSVAEFVLRLVQTLVWPAVAVVLILVVWWMLRENR